MECKRFSEDIPGRTKSKKVNLLAEFREKKIPFGVFFIYI